MGSVHYTSPEQARGGVVDQKSDLYSIGITMYEMITGHVPFDGDSTVSVALKHLQEEITSPAEEVPNIPYSLECIIMKCTQKNPGRRYPDCASLLMDLKRSLVEPDGDFVVLGAGTGSETDRTMVMSKKNWNGFRAVVMMMMSTMTMMSTMMTTIMTTTTIMIMITEGAVKKTGGRRMM